MKLHKTWILILTLLLELTAAQAAKIRLTIPDSSGVVGTTISVPVRVEDDLSGQDVFSYQLQIFYNQSILSLDKVIINNTLTNQWGYMEFNTVASNQVMISAAGDVPLTGKGVLVFLRFEIIGVGGSNIYFSDTLHTFFNQGKPSLELNAGYFNAAAPPKITVSPNNAVLIPGEQKQFYVSGGQSPYQWSTSDPAIATIDLNGLLTGVSPGNIRVYAQDSEGVIDSTDKWVEVRPFRIFFKDSSVYQGQTLKLPVYVTDLTEAQVTSGNFKITFYQKAFKAVDVTTKGTLLESADSHTFNAYAGALEFAFASSAPLSGSGILCYIELESSATYSGGVTFGFAEVLFNENIQPATASGYCSVLKPAAITISPVNAQLFTGQTKQFAASGGTPPYQWSVSSSQTAQIDADGLMTALHSGEVRVLVTDAVGAKGQTNPIKIYDCQVVFPDTSGMQSSYFEYVIHLRQFSVTEPVYSFQLSVTIDTLALKFKDIRTSGTLANSWSVSSNLDRKNLIIAAAGTDPITGNGDLLRIRFYITNRVSIGYRANLILQSFSFNEGYPLPLTDNGFITVVEPTEPPASAPQLISPADGQTGVSNSPTFYWHSVLYAQNYQLQVSKNADLSAAVFDQNTITDTSFTVSSLDANTTYYWRVKALNAAGNSAWSEVWSFSTLSTGLDEPARADTPTEYRLDQNYPNPFNSSTVITFSLPEPTHVQLLIYDVTGKLIFTLLEKRLSSGTYNVHFDGANLQSGIYFYRLRTPGFEQVKRMFLIK